MKKVSVLRIGVPTSTGRVFSREVVEAAMDDIVEDGNRLLVTIGGGMKLTDVCGHVVELTLDEDELVANVEFLETPTGKLVAEVVAMGKDPSFFMSGKVKSDKDGNVKSLTLTGLDAKFESNG